MEEEKWSTPAIASEIASLRLKITRLEFLIESRKIRAEDSQRQREIRNSEELRDRKFGSQELGDKAWEGSGGEGGKVGGGLSSEEVKVEDSELYGGEGILSGGHGVYGGRANTGDARGTEVKVEGADGEEASNGEIRDEDLLD